MERSIIKSYQLLIFALLRSPWWNCYTLILFVTVSFWNRWQWKEMLFFFLWLWRSWMLRYVLVLNLTWTWFASTYFQWSGFWLNRIIVVYGRRLKGSSFSDWGLAVTVLNWILQKLSPLFDHGMMGIKATDKSIRRKKLRVLTEWKEPFGRHKYMQVVEFGL